MFSRFVTVAWLRPDVDAKLDTRLIPGEKVVDASDDVWDAIVGVRGLADLNDKWWLSFSLLFPG